MRPRVLAAALGLAALASSGCKRQPDFAERYDAASAQISGTAAQIDAQVSGTSPSDEPGGPEEEKSGDREKS